MQRKRKYLRGCDVDRVCIFMSSSLLVKEHAQCYVVHYIHSAH